MLAILALQGCVVLSAIVITGVAISIVAGGISIGVSVMNGQAAEAAADKARQQQEVFHIKQLKMQKADKARQKILTQENLKKTRSAVMTSVGLNDLMAARATREGNKLRRENALNGAGVNSRVSTKPKGSYFYGNAV